MSLVLLSILAPLVIVVANIVVMKLSMDRASTTGQHGYGIAFVVGLGLLLVSALVGMIPTVGWVLSLVVSVGGVWFVYKPKVSDLVGMLLLQVVVGAGLTLVFGLLFVFLGVFSESLSLPGW